MKIYLQNSYLVLRLRLDKMKICLQNSYLVLRLRLDARARPPWCICQCSQSAQHQAQEKPLIIVH
jgi:hypothetical protein